MSGKKRLIIAIGVLLPLAMQITATDNLRIPDLRTLSMGGGGVTETSMFNPAILGIRTQSKLYVNYYNRYSVSELATVSGGFLFDNEKLPVGIDIMSFGYDKYRESMFRLSFGKQIAEKFTAGIAVQYLLLQSELFEESSGRISTDIGITYQPSDDLLTALSVLHLPSVKTGDENIANEHLSPYSLHLGIRYLFMGSLLVTGSVRHNEEETVAGCAGLEYTPFEDFKIRTGIYSSPLRPSLGAGCRIANIQADAGVVYHAILGISMGVGISYEF